jgi:hypothetical protein
MRRNSSQPCSKTLKAGGFFHVWKSTSHGSEAERNGKAPPHVHLLSTLEDHHQLYSKECVPSTLWKTDGRIPDPFWTSTIPS